VRLHTEYCVQFWPPWYRIDSVQQRATEMMKGLEPLLREKAETAGTV